MTSTDISNIRLISQQVASTKFKTVKDIVGWMGAMQAQDYAMSKWAIGARLPNSTDKVIQAAIDKGEIIRTHLMRPTWHLVSADDIYWLLELTAPRIKASAKSRHNELGVTESLQKKCNAIITEALTGGNHLTKEELAPRFEEANIDINSNRFYHFMLCAELDGIACSGAIKGNKQTYALLNERVSKPKSLTREEALKKIAHKYFSSHGPATLQDFSWWSGLSVSDARNALDMVKSNFVSETVGAETYWFSNSFSKFTNDNHRAYLLPAYDEFIISYKDRSPSLQLENHPKAVSNNGVFKPVIVINGQVAGLWRRTIIKDRVVVETDFFQSPNKSIKGLIEKEAEIFGSFLGKKVAVKHNTK